MTAFRVKLTGAEKLVKRIGKLDGVVTHTQRELRTWTQTEALGIAQGATPVDTGRLRAGWRVGRVRGASGRFAGLGVRGRGGRFTAIGVQSLANPTPYAKYVFDRLARRSRSAKERANLRRWENAAKRIGKLAEGVVKREAEKAAKRAVR